MIVSAKRNIKFLVVMGFIAASVAISSSALAAKPGDVFKDWVVGCEDTPGESGKQLCHIAQSITAKKTGQQLLHAMIGTVGKENKTVLILTLPLGVALPPGVRIQVDENKASVNPIEVCTKQGCRLGINLNDRMLKMMKKGRTMKVTITNIQRRPITIPMSLSGISAGLNSLKK